MPMPTLKLVSSWKHIQRNPPPSEAPQNTIHGVYTKYDLLQFHIPTSKVIHTGAVMSYSECVYFESIEMI